MYKNTPALKIFDSVDVDGSRARGRCPLHYRDQVGKYRAALGISNWGKIAKRRNGWHAVVNSAITAQTVSTPLKKKKKICGTMY